MGSSLPVVDEGTVHMDSKEAVNVNVIQDLLARLVKDAAMTLLSVQV